MRLQMVISVATVIAILAMITPAFAQCGFGGPAGCGFGGPAGCGFGGPVGCGIGGFGGCGIPFGGCGFGVPFGIGGCGFCDPLTSIVGLGISMISSVLGAAFSCIPGLGFGGCGIPFGGCGVPFGGFC
jgi:hypothetical protein